MKKRVKAGERGEGDECDGNARSPQAVAGELDRALALSAGNEVVRRGEGQADAAVGTGEVLGRDLARALCGVVHVDAVALEAAEYDIACAIGDDAGVRALVAQHVDAALETLDAEAVAAGCPGDVLDACAVA